MPESTLLKPLERISVQLAELIKISASGVNATAGKPILPYQSGSKIVAQMNTKPARSDLYPTKLDIWALSGRFIPHATITNEGAGDLYFVLGYGRDEVSAIEDHLAVNDSRELYNVFELRLRSTLPQSTFRLTEGVSRSGSLSPASKSNTEIRPTLQANEKLKGFAVSMDNIIAPVFPVPVGMLPITPPVPVSYLGPSFVAPIAAGTTQQLFDVETALPMPFIVPVGHVLESFAILWNFTVNSTLRVYFELQPGSGVYNLAFVIPISAREPPNLVLNINPISTQIVDPFGAPAGGRGVLFTITNDDAAASMIGEIDVLMVLRQLA